MDTYEDGAGLCDVSCDDAVQVAVTYTHSPVNLVETLGLEIGVRQAGTPAADRAAQAVADAFSRARARIP